MRITSPVWLTALVICGIGCADKAKEFDVDQQNARTAVRAVCSYMLVGLDAVDAEHRSEQALSNLFLDVCASDPAIIQELVVPGARIHVNVDPAYWRLADGSPESLRTYGAAIELDNGSHRTYVIGRKDGTTIVANQEGFEQLERHGSFVISHNDLLKQCFATRKKVPAIVEWTHRAK